MIFNIEGHIEMIRNGLFWYDGIDNPDYSAKAMKEYFTHRAQFLADRLDISEEVKAGLHPLIVKTQTRRLNRGIYQICKDYAVQRKRGVKAEPYIRIVMDRILKEDCIADELAQEGYLCPATISEEDAWAEGGYTPARFESVFKKLNPMWDGKVRWVFEFHVIEVYTKDEKGIYRKFDDAQKELDKEEQQKLERSLKHLHQEITEHIHPYVTTKIEKVRK